jgi:hypothetical protein
MARKVKLSAWTGGPGRLGQADEPGKASAGTLASRATQAGGPCFVQLPAAVPAFRSPRPRAFAARRAR